MTRRPEGFGTATDAPAQIAINDIVNADRSYVIEGRSEYGVTNLGQRLEWELVRVGQKAIRRSARELPNYRKKLEAEFSDDVRCGTETVLVLDDFNADRDERLLREIVSTGWFGRLILLSVDRSLLPGRLVDLTGVVPGLETAYLWCLGRQDVRFLTERFFATKYPVFTSSIVDKVYADLLALKIPLTPPNVIMYLRVIHREGDYNPLNRVDIVGRYISDVLRRPSDVYMDSFNSKNRSDIVSRFVYQLYCEKSDTFDEKKWLNFCAKYQADVLVEFDSVSLLGELIESRIFVKNEGVISLRYAFFYEFFLGKYVAARPKILETFIGEEEYLRLSGVVEVVSGLSADNSTLVGVLTERLEVHLAGFADKYVRPTLDPLAQAIWPDSSKDDEELWRPIAAQIAAGPRSPEQIDILKASLDAEARTAIQTVTFTKFVEMETALFANARVLEDAIKNSDDVGRELKIRAFDAVRRAHLVSFQIGATFSAIIAERPYFAWGGVVFVNFDQAARGIEGKAEAQTSVVTALSHAIALSIAESVGIKKLAPTFRAIEKEPGAGFPTFLTFACVVASRGAGWERAAQIIIERADKNAYYLYAMLDILMHSLQNEILSVRDRDASKRLVALIEAKRSFNKQAPGAKAVDKMLEHLESIDHFAPSAVEVPASREGAQQLEPRQSVIGKLPKES